MTIIGRTGSGKTHIALELADMRRQVLFLALKRSDPLVTGLAARGYYVTDTLEDVLRTARDGRPVHPHVVLWPEPARRPGLDAEARAALLRPIMKRAMVWAEDTRDWTIVLDETMFLAEELRLQRDLNMLWFQGRTQHVSVLALAQRPARIPRLGMSQPSFFFIGIAQDKDDRDRLRDIPAAIPRELIEQGIMSLNVEAHEFLFLDTKSNGMAIVTAPA